MAADRFPSGEHDAQDDPRPGATGAVGPVVITPMRRRHLRSVMRIESQAVHRGWSVGLYLAELRREQDRVYLVAKIGSDVVGFGGLLLQDEDAHITTIGVDEVKHGQRIGSRLMLALARAAIGAGAQNLTLEVRATNEPAIKLYRRFGLAPAGVRKNYYADIGEDAIVMWGHEIDSPAYASRLAAVEADIDARTGTTTTLEGFEQ